MNEDGLKAFLVESNEAGYAGGDEKKWLREADRSTTIAFELGSWKSHDNFFGGEPYGGRMVVSYQDRPVWMMVYYGWVVADMAPEEVYTVLKNALMHMPADSPFRGPELFEAGRFTYTNHWLGEVSRFSGQEEISEGSKVVYRADYVGGWVDSRRG